MEYVKEKPILEINDSQKKSQLISSIISTREELKKTHKNFEYAEGDLIDFYAYQIMALQSKLNYLTKLAKLQNIDFNYVYQKVV